MAYNQQGYRVLTFSWKVRQRSVFKSVWDSLPGDGLLSHAGYHLRDIDERPLGSTQSHSEGAVGVVELLLASLTCRLANDRELSKDDGLQGFLRSAARLRLKLTLLIALDVLITLGIATKLTIQLHVHVRRCKHILRN